MCCQIVGLGLRCELFYILQNGVDMIFKCIQGVLTIMVVILLLGGFVIALAGHVELLSRSRIIVLQNFVKEDIPNLELEHEKRQAVSCWNQVITQYTIKNHFACLLLTFGAISPVSVWNKRSL